MQQPHLDLTFGDLRDMEARDRRGELSEDERELLKSARASLRSNMSGNSAALAAFTESMHSLTRALRPASIKMKPIARVIVDTMADVGAPILRHMEEYDEEVKWVKRQPLQERKRYEHMTMPQIREVRGALKATSRCWTSGRRREHRPVVRARRTAARRAAGVRAGVDPGEPAEPASDHRSGPVGA
jgi:hypothetical protein